MSRFAWTASLAVACGLAGAAAACGGAAATPGRRLLDERFDAPAVAEARRVAPDLVAAAERARALAERARARGEAAAAADETTRARLLLEAALVEARRVREERAREEAEDEVRALTLAALRDEAARAELDRENARRAALRVLRDELARALARAEASEPRRGGRLASGDPADARRAAEALAARARLLMGAAVALGAPPPAVARAEAALERHALATGDPARALAAADEARRAAETALGLARARAVSGADGAPGGASRGGADHASAAAALAAAVEAIAEDAEARGLGAHMTERGLVLRAPAAFAGTALAPAAGVVGALAAVARTAPGPVRVWVEASGGRHSRLGATRAARLLEALIAAGLPRERLSVEAAPPRVAPATALAPSHAEAAASREAPGATGAGVLLPLLGPPAAAP